jgi:homocysteine S-methyltransferase
LGYTVNCVHPAHLEPVLRHAQLHDAPWLTRFRGMRGNASRRSHAELDQSTELDSGDPEELGRHVDVRRRVLRNGLESSSSHR